LLKTATIAVSGNNIICCRFVVVFGNKVLPLRAFFVVAVFGNFVAWCGQAFRPIDADSLSVSIFLLLPKIH